MVSKGTRIIQYDDTVPNKYDIFKIVIEFRISTSPNFSNVSLSVPRGVPIA